MTGEYLKGKVLFFIGKESHRLVDGDIVDIPPDLPPTIQLLTLRARLVDTFTPVRQEFL